MFILLDKEKIASYMVLLSTVVILFGLAFMIKTDDIIVTSTKDIELNSDEIVNNSIVNEVSNIIKYIN